MLLLDLLSLESELLLLPQPLLLALRRLLLPLLLQIERNELSIR
jgi:hypothetical protein